MVKKRGWLFAATVASAGALAAAALFWRASVGPPEPSLGQLRVTPPPGRVSVRVGDAVQFTAEAEGASRFVWSLWGREASTGAQWSYVPGPEDAGWQQVRLVVSAPDQARVERTWDVGVIAAVPPELVEVTPPPGAVALPADRNPTFRIRARVPAARPADRLRFEWMMDGRPLRRDEQGAVGGVSTLVIGAPAPGKHRVGVRVSEDERVASLAEWSFDVAAVRPSVPAVALAPPPTAPRKPEPPAVEPAVGTPPTPEPPPAEPVVVPPAPPEVAPPPKLVSVPTERRFATEVGAPLSFSVRLNPPPETALSYRWSVDGRAQRVTEPDFSYEPDKTGSHRIAVTVLADGRTIGRDAWVVAVRPPEKPEDTAPAAEPAPPPTDAVARVAPPTTEEVARVAPPTPPTTEELARVAPPTPPPTEAVARVAPPPATDVIARVAPPEPVAPAGSGLAEGDVRRWLEEYARAWSRKDADALQRMGQVRSAAEADRLRRYFESINALRVDVRVLGLRVEGDRASVEFERMDTVTDPSGRQQQLRLPAMRKEIERTPDGLRFTSGGGRG